LSVAMLKIFWKSLSIFFWWNLTESSLCLCHLPNFMFKH